mgnify:CR=1 FL=1
MLLEVLIAVVVIIVILLLVGVPVGSILNLLILALSGLLLLMIGFFVLFFLITDIALLFFRRVKGTFIRFDDTGRYDRAVYAVGDKEYTCTFPAESVARRKIYQEQTQYTLLISRRKQGKTAYDKHSLFIITIGSIFAYLLAALCIWAALTWL